MRKKFFAEVFGILVLLMISAGCARTAGELTTLRDILSLAEQDRVSGRVRVSLGGGVEVGLREGFYLSSPGTHLDADLTFRFQDVGSGRQGEESSK